MVTIATGPGIPVGLETYATVCGMWSALVSGLLASNNF
jgi:hypothetical protein